MVEKGVFLSAFIKRQCYCSNGVLEEETIWNMHQK